MTSAHRWVDRTAGRAAASVENAAAQDRLLRLAVVLLTLPTAILVLAALGFAAGYPVGAATFGGALLATGAVFVWTRGDLSDRDSIRKYDRLTAAIWAVLAASAVAATFLIDFSYDGMNYHLPAVDRLADGANPFDAAARALPPLPDSRLHADYIASQNAKFIFWTKATWYWSAAVGAVTGSSETGKAFHILMLFASTALLLVAAGPKPGGLRLLAVCLIALNPVVLKQLFVNYVDGDLAALLNALAATLAIGSRRFDRFVAVALGATLICLVNVKATGVVFAVLILGAYLLGRIVRRRSWAGIAAVAALGLGVGVAGVGYSPYVTNTLEHGNPFYPLGNRGARLDSAGETVRHLAVRVARNAYGLFRRAEIDTRRPAPLKLPFWTDPRDLTSSVAYASQTGGLGPYFALGVLAAALFAAAAMLERRAVDWDMAAIFLGVAIGVAFFPEGWVHRFVPQFWLLPLWLLLAFKWLPGGTASLRTGRAVLIIAAVNVAITGAGGVAVAAYKNVAIRNDYARIAALPQPLEIATVFVPTTRHRLTERGVAFEITPILACDAPVKFTHARISVCPAK